MSIWRRVMWRWRNSCNNWWSRVCVRGITILLVIIMAIIVMAIIIIRITITTTLSTTITTHQQKSQYTHHHHNTATTYHRNKIMKTLNNNIKTIQNYNYPQIYKTNNNNDMLIIFVIHNKKIKLRLLTTTKKWSIKIVSMNSSRWGIRLIQNKLLVAIS